MEQQMCKFLVRKTVQNIVHNSCINPVMLKTNKPSGEKIPCIDGIGAVSCGQAVYDNPSEK